MSHTFVTEVVARILKKIMRINKKHTQEHEHALAYEQAHELVFRLALFTRYSRKVWHPDSSE